MEMTRRRWIADEVSENGAALTGAHARHLAQVLRAQIGQEFDIATGADVRRGKITSVGTDRVEFELGETISETDQVQISVALAIFKFDRMEWAIEKCTELGVARIIPVVAARTESHLAKAASNRVDRWRRIAKQASEQSRRASVPQIDAPIKFAELIAFPFETKIVLSETEDKLMLRNAIPKHSRSALLAFGQEGGWKDQELNSFRESGWTAASLGGTILRAETAVIAAVAIVTSILEP